MGALLQKIPERISDTEVLQFIRIEDDDSEFVNSIKDFTSLPDQILADWLDINVKTFRSFKTPSAEIRQKMKEQIVLLISLYKHGADVFGSVDLFWEWLNRDNFFLEDAKPIQFLHTVTGVRFISERVTAIEYGDNV